METILKTGNGFRKKDKIYEHTKRLLKNKNGHVKRTCHGRLHHERFWHFYSYLYPSASLQLIRSIQSLIITHVVAYVKSTLKHSFCFFIEMCELLGCNNVEHHRA